MMKATLGAVGVGLAGLMLCGCEGPQRAQVEFKYVVNPGKGLPPGMNTIYVAPAVVGPNTDARWSDLTATILKALVQESSDQFGTKVAITDRRDTQGVMDEADLKAAGMSTKQGGEGGKLEAAEGRILSNINIKVDVHEKKDSTLDITNIAGWGGHRSGGGGVEANTREVTGYQRTMTVQTEYKLLDNANNKVWSLKAGTYTATDETRPASPIYGSNRGLGDLPPEDQIIAALVDQGAREFVSDLMACRINVSASIKSSGSKECADGVNMLRAGAWAEALASFQAALAKNGRDHRAAFGAGLACEAMGDGERALGFYRTALAGANDAQYAAARARMEAFGGRIKK